MRPPLYRRQLVQDLDVWVARGWVAPGRRAEILAHIEEGGGFGLSAVLGLMGAALIAAAVLSFVAANWQELDKAARLAVLAGGLWGGFGLAAWAESRKLIAVREAALIAALGVYGASIWFVGQTYHLSGGTEDGLMLWALGALAAGLLAGSQSAMTVGFLLAIVWMPVSWANDTDTFLWLAPIGIVAGLAGTMLRQWPVALQAGLLAAVIYLVIAAYRVADLAGLPSGTASVMTAAIALAAWCALHAPSERYEWTVRPARFWALIVAILAVLIASHQRIGMPPSAWAPFAMAAMIMMGFGAFAGAARRRLPVLHALIAAAFGAAILLAPFAVGPSSDYVAFELPLLTLAGLMLVWTIAIGLQRGDRLAVNLGFVAFGLWVVYLYASVFESFLNGAMFFGVGGVLLIALALGLDRIRRRMLTGAAS
jgi:uncharacterized membrane protein